MSSAPTLNPLTLNCTPTTPTLSDAVAESVTNPETVEPASGDITVAVGGVVSVVAPVPITSFPVAYAPMFTEAPVERPPTRPAPLSGDPAANR